MSRLRDFSPTARGLADAFVVLAFGLVAFSQGAPAWALTLLLFCATRSSRLDTAADLGALQEAIHEAKDPPA